MSTLVIDTNFLLSNLNIVKGLVDDFRRFSHSLIIPSTVLEELDGLKQGQSTASRQARTAIQCIHKWLACSHPGIRGQRLSEFVQTGLKGDDSILDCCRFFAARGFTVLCSNDRNLCAKALSNDLKTVSFVPGMTAVLIGVKVSVAAGFMAPEVGDQILAEQERTESPAVEPETDPLDHDMADMSEIVESTHMPPVLEIPEDNYTSAAKLQRDVTGMLLQNAAALVDFIMHKSFGPQELEYFKYKKPPPEAKSIQNVLERYRLEVFTEYLPRRVYTELSNWLKKPVSDFNKGLFDTFIDLWGSIVVHLSKNDTSYRHAVNSLKAVVDRFYA